MSNFQAAELRRLLRFTTDALREQAAEHAYRSRAMKAIRERLLADYHERRRQEAINLRAAVLQLVDALEPPEDRAWRLEVPHVTKPGPGAPVVDDDWLDLEPRELPPLDVDDAAARGRRRRRVPGRPTEAIEAPAGTRSAIEALDAQRRRG
jgi:hypothetical protein